MGKGRKKQVIKMKRRKNLEKKKERIKKRINQTKS